MTNKLPLTHVWQKWRFSTPQTVLCNVQHSFSALAFVVKIATFAKRLNVSQTYKRLTTLQSISKEWSFRGIKKPRQLGRV